MMSGNPLPNQRLFRRTDHHAQRLYLLTQLAGDALRAHRLCLLALRLCLPRNLVCPNIQLLPIESLKWKKWAFLPLLHLLPPRNPDLISLICMLIINLTRTSLLTRIRTRMRIPRRLFTTRFPSTPPLKSPRAPKSGILSIIRVGTKF